MAKAKPRTKFDVSSFIGFRDIVQSMPNFLGVTWPRLRPLSEILYLGPVGRAKMKLYTNLELCSFTSFGDTFEGMPKILGVMWPRPCPFQKYYISTLWKWPRRIYVPNLNSVALFLRQCCDLETKVSWLEFIFRRSRSWSRDQGIKVLVLVSRPKGQGLGLGLESVSYTHLTLPTNREV